ncbi:MAG: HAD family hydrolase [Candidatus Heimdallarchaeota archaeon]|nr:HAD family hydrolase [Candidatus Heimdallarchaeota archaeon]
MATVWCSETELNDIELVCFDKDGTLLSLNMYIPVMEKRTELLLERFHLSEESRNDILELMGLNPDTLEIIWGGPIHIERVEIIRRTREYLRKFSINSTVEDIAEIFDEVDSLVDFSDNVEVYEGVNKVLQELRKEKIKTLLVTHDGKEPAEKQLMSAGLFHLFDLVLGLDIDSPYNAKPAPDMLQYACKILEVDVTKSVVIGDDDRDMLMGKNAGASCCIGVLTGRSEEKDLMNADVIIQSVSDIKIKL